VGITKIEDGKGKNVKSDKKIEAPSLDKVGQRQKNLLRKSIDFTRMHAIPIANNYLRNILLLKKRLEIYSFCFNNYRAPLNVSMYCTNILTQNTNKDQ